MNTVVIGKSGQLALSLKAIDSNLLCFGREDIDITCKDNIDRVLGPYKIGRIINASAYTAVDKAEVEHKQAFSINCDAVINLANFASKINAHFVHVSTDYVFSGTGTQPYSTDEPLAPLGVYGRSKAAGERALQSIMPQSSCIIRTSWVYSMYGSNFVKTMLQVMKGNPVVSVVSDQIGSPTSSIALARACLLASNKNAFGIYHFSDNGVCSWYDFALEIQRLGIQHGILDKIVKVKPIKASEYPTVATRPKYSVLNKSSFEDNFKEINISCWQSELSMVIKQLANYR